MATRRSLSGPAFTQAGPQGVRAWPAARGRHLNLPNVTVNALQQFGQAPPPVRFSRIHAR